MDLVLKLTFLCQAFLLSFTVSAQQNYPQYIQRMTERVQNDPNFLVKLSNPEYKGSTPVYVIIQGIDFGPASEWYPVFNAVKSVMAPSYFIKIDKDKNKFQNLELLEKSLQQIVAEHGTYRPIEILGFSTGGLLALYRWDELKLSVGGNLHLTTVASPLGGYDPPKVFWPFVRLFAGPLTTFVAYGAGGFLKEQYYTNCTHIVNTDEQLDRHAPAQLLQHMPCPTTIKIKMKHMQALEYAVKKIMKGHHINFGTPQRNLVPQR